MRSDSTCRARATRRVWRVLVLGALVALGLAGRIGAEEAPVEASADAPATVVARAVLRGAPSGGVFFLRQGPEAPVVAIGAAHSFDRTALAEAGEVRFLSQDGHREVARSSRYYARPGVPYRAFGGTLRGDFLIFALAEPPQGVRALTPADRPVQAGAAVHVLGAARRGSNVERIDARVAVAEAERIFVDLDGYRGLDGFGGAPVLDAAGGVVGMLQSAAPFGRGMRLGIGPIGGVVEALAEPYEGGLGRLFATLAPAPSAATDPTARRRAATGSPFGSGNPDSAAAVASRAAVAASMAPRELRLSIETPDDGAVVGNAAFAFVAGHASALRGQRSRIDIVIVIDTSVSTSGPAGLDVDGDGELGVLDPDAVPGFDDVTTDPGDSILAAEISAARELLRGLDPRVSRVALVTFAGEADLRLPPGPRGFRIKRAATTEEPLTSDHARLHAALDRLGERRPRGQTHMAAGVDLATLELLGLPGSLSLADPDSEKLVLFLTDGRPTLPSPSEPNNVRSVLASAQRARRAGIRIHTFAIGPEALSGPISTVEMAAITDGLFTPVREPGRLARFVETVSFASVEDVVVRNETRDLRVVHARTHADGSWNALVPLVPGSNQIVVRARSSEGDEATRELRVRYEPGGSTPPVPAEWIGRHNDLLRDHLVALRTERDEATRRELVIEIERERAAAEQRAAAQRKELEIEAVPGQ